MVTEAEEEADAYLKVSPTEFWTSHKTRKAQNAKCDRVQETPPVAVPTARERKIRDAQRAALHRTNSRMSSANSLADAINSALCKAPSLTARRTNL